MNQIKELINGAELVEEVNIKHGFIKEASINEFLKPKTEVFKCGEYLYRKSGEVSSGASKWLKLSLQEPEQGVDQESIEKPQEIDISGIKAYVDIKLEEMAKEFMDYVNGEFQRRGYGKQRNKGN